MQKPDNAKARRLINDIKDEPEEKDILGEKFETSLSQIAKSKKNSREVFKSLQGNSKDFQSNSKEPFQRSSLSRGRGGRGRGFTFGGFRNNQYNKGNYSSWGKSQYFVKCNPVTSETIQLSSPSSVNVVSQQIPQVPLGRRLRHFLTKLIKLLWE